MTTKTQRWPSLPPLPTKLVALEQAVCDQFCALNAATEHLQMARAAVAGPTATKTMKMASSANKYLHACRLNHARALGAYEAAQRMIQIVKDERYAV